MSAATKCLAGFAIVLFGALGAGGALAQSAGTVEPGSGGNEVHIRVINNDTKPARGIRAKLSTVPKQVKSAHFDPGAIEWRWRDVGEEVTNVADLAAAIDRALSDPGKRAAKRAEYRKLLFDDLTDGDAVRRIVAEVSGL